MKVHQEPWNYYYKFKTALTYDLPFSKYVLVSKETNIDNVFNEQQTIIANRNIIFNTIVKKKPHISLVNISRFLKTKILNIYNRIINI